MAKKQSGDLASILAAAWLKRMAGKRGYHLVPAIVIRTLAASVLSQDETKGPRRKRRPARTR